MNNKGKRRLVVIGIDGGTFKIIDSLIKKGKLPHLDKIIKSGVRGILKSTYPPVTAAAWVSFMTGKNPGKHGFFDFREYNPEEYVPSFIPVEKDAVKEKVTSLHSSRFSGKTIWDFLGDAGYEMTVVAVPMTYPPWKINGRMVSGFPSPDYSKTMTYPSDWSKEIGQLFNMSAINYSRPEECIDECKELVRRKGRIILEQMRNEKGEVFSVVFSSADFAQHFFWKYLEKNNHPFASVIDEIYEEIDKILGVIMTLMDEDTSLVIMSDHGFMRHPDGYFNMNSWLVKEKYINLKKDRAISRINYISRLLDAFITHIVHKKTKLKSNLKTRATNMPLFMQKWISRQYFKSNLIDWNRTRAFRFKMYGTVEGIVINRKGRQKNGIVENEDEYEKLRDEIIEKLLQLKDPDTGIRVVAEAYKREYLYHDNYIKHAPDIIINFAPDYIGGVEVKGPLFSQVSDETKEMFSGIHNQDGIFILTGPNAGKGKKILPANIVDIVPTILVDLGLQIPDDMDGKVIWEAFSDSFKSRSPVYKTVEKESERNSESLTEEEEEMIQKHLKGLGYL